MNLSVEKYIISLLFIVNLALLPGCKNGFFSPSIDSGRDAEGNVILLDTPKNWDFWVSVVNFDVNNELNGSSPPGGSESWNERWLGSIRELEKGRQENYQKYINYIIERRREAGLPPLIM